MSRTSKTAVLGSGHSYLLEINGDIPSIAQIISQCTPDKRFGTTSNGATLTYTGETHTEQDDMGYVVVTILTKEEVKLKLGMFSWCVDDLTKLSGTIRVAEEGELKVARIGGLNNDNRKSYIVVFEHVDKVNGNIYTIIVGKNTAGLSIAFAKDAVSKIEPEFTAEPQDDDGTLASIVEAPPGYNPAQQTEGT